VQTKTPLLTIESVRDAENRGKHVACEVHESMGVSNGTTALGIAVALGEIAMPRSEQICKDLDLYSSVASCSSGVELTQAQIVLLGNKAGAGGRFRIGHAVMRDALDIDGIYAAIHNAGLELPERARADDLKRRIVAAPCGDAGRSCSMIPMCTITGMPRARSEVWRPPRLAIPPYLYQWTPCTKDRTAAAP